MRLSVNNATSPSPAKVACRVRGHTATPAARGTYGVHMRRTMREWSNAACGARLLKTQRSPSADSFHPRGQDISCMQILFYRAAVASQSSECASSLSKGRNEHPSSCRCLSVCRFTLSGLFYEGLFRERLFQPPPEGKIYIWNYFI